MRSFFSFFILSLLFFVSVVRGESLDEALFHLQNREYPQAISLLEKSLETGKSDQLFYLLGNTCYLAGEYTKSLQYLDQLLKEYPQSPLCFKASYKKADVALKQKNFESAYQIYLSAVQRVTHNKRKGELAQIYLTFAERFFKPTDPDQVADYQKALLMYKEAAELTLEDDLSQQIRLKQALCYYHLRNYSQAISLLEELKKGYATQSPAAQKTSKALYEESSYYLAQSYALAQDPAKARLLFQDFLALFPESTWTPSVLFHISETYKFPEPYSNADLESGIRVLQELLQKYPQHRLAPQASYHIGSACFYREHYDRAIGEFQRVASIPGDPHYQGEDYPALAALQIGYCYSRQKAFDRAKTAWQDYLIQFPSHHQWTTIQQELIHLEYSKGEGFYQEKQWEKLRYQWRDFLSHYPLDSRVPSLMYRLGESFVLEEKWEEAIREWNKLLQKFPQSDEASHAQFATGDVYETKLYQFEKAMETYRTLTWGSYANLARSRLAQMKQKELQVQTKRVFLSTETPQVEVQTRNFEQLKIRVYEVDLLAYFQKMNTISGLEKLDLALIEPDHTFDYTIPAYEPYRLLVSQVSLPQSFHRPGVYALNLSSDTKEAFTIVVVSDIALILKSTKQDLLVFAENMAQKKPAKNTQIAISDGSTLLFQGQTDDNGFYSLQSEELQQKGDLRVFGYSPQGVASNELNLSQLSYSKGLSPKGYLYTDRPAYRPGETVHLRGILREVRESAYAFKAGDRYEVQVLSEQGKRVYSSPAELSAFGTFHCTFVLPQAASVGTYRIQVSQKEGSSFNHSFKVQEYQLEPYKLTILPDKPYFFRGESIEGTIRVAYYYGEPVRNKPVSYEITSQASKQELTDDKGEIRFSFPSSVYQEEARLTLNAVLEGENVYLSQDIGLVTRGFVIQISTLRDVFLTEEAFDVTVKTSSQEKAVATSLNYEVFHLVENPPYLAEKKIQDGSLQTPESGENRFRLSLEKGGKYRIRFQGEDRFKNKVVATHEVFISDEKDSEKLRVLSDSDHFFVGDKAVLQVLWRGEESLALITHEGERIYQSYLKTLSKGKNLLEIEMSSLLAPNFNLGVAVMEGNTFSHVSKSFKVSRRLHLAVKTAKTQYLPSETLEVEIVATNSQGKGVVAEVSLSLVDEALLSLFPHKLPEIASFFYGSSRVIRVATSSTNTFSFQGICSEISQEFLKELEKSIAAQLPAPNAPVLKLKDRRGGYTGEGGEEKIDFPDLRDSAEGGGRSYAKKAGGKMASRGGDGKKNTQMDLDAVRKLLSSTAYWNPSIVTDREGKATVKITLPDQTTSWKFFLYGVNTEILVGQASHDIQVKKEFFVDLKIPKNLVAGDEPHPLVLVHNHSKDIWTGQVSLSTEVESETKTSSIKVTLPPGVSEHSFKLGAVEAGTVKWIASAKNLQFSDQLEKTMEVQKRATVARRGTGGVATQDVKYALVLPPEKYKDVRVGVQFGPSLASVLLDTQLSSLSDASTTSANALGAYFVLEYLEKAGTPASTPHHQWLDSFEGGVQNLLHNQNDDGGFNYSGYTALNANAKNQSQKRFYTASDPQISALSLRALALARKRGVQGLEEAIAKGVTYLNNAFSKASRDAEKASLLYALAEASEIQFAYVNRLYRERQSLDNYSLALLSLIFSRIERGNYATEVAELLLQRNLSDSPSFKSENDSDRQVLSWLRDPVELRALATLAFLKAKLPQSQIDPLIQNLMESRAYKNWSSPKANAVVLEALSYYLSTYQPNQSDRYQLSIWLNQNKVYETEVQGSQPIQELYFPLPQGTSKAQLEIKAVGRFRFTYQAMIEGWIDGLKSPHKDAWFYLNRYVHRPALTFKGKTITRGFQALSGNYSSWRNTILNLPEGSSSEVELNYSPRHQTYDSYLILEEPLPGGSTVLEPSLTGDFENYEIHKDRIVFYLNKAYGTIRYQLYGYLKGAYQVPPTRIWSLFEPYRLSTGDPSTLRILERGSSLPDPFKATPDELYELGKLHFEAGELSEAKPYLVELFEYENLRETQYKETVRMLLYIAIEEKEDAFIVKYFEILKERYPQLVVDFGRILKIGTAYGNLKEFERGLQVFRATLEASFLKESTVSGTLSEQGELQSSFDFMRDLLLYYPDLPVIQTSFFALSQLLYEWADKSKEELKRYKVTSESLMESAIQKVELFLTYYPENPIADEASFSLANLYLSQKSYTQAVALCKVLLKRFPKSAYLDDFLYIQGYSHFYLREYENALGLLKRLATERFPNGQGEQVLSENRFLAQYIMGQIHHSRSEIPQAIEFYSKIKQQFEDAKDAIEYFERQELQLKEISSFTLGEPVSVELTHRNLKGIDLKVYKVDLMKLYLLKKNLNQITTIHLAGIKPSHTRLESFSDRYRETKTKLTLPLSEEGAYLVMVKGENLNSSGMVLISNLKAIVQEDPDSGIVRVNVMNQSNQAYVDQAHVKVVGSVSQKFQSGNTDLRGIFVAENIQGAATAIVKKGNQYAFYRGVDSLQTKAPPEILQKLKQELAPLNKQIEDLNLDNRGRQSKQLKELFEANEDGVKVEKTY
jgi:uncharacterized protein YfaS (alpha-2-macroglobulin family)/TolA-binding protein